MNWNNYQSKIIEQSWSRYLDFLIDPTFQGINRFFVLSFDDRKVRQSYEQYLLTVEIKNHNIKINARNFFNQPVKNDLRKSDNIQKTSIGQGHDYIAVCLLDYLKLSKNTIS